MLACDASRSNSPSSFFLGIIAFDLSPITRYTYYHNEIMALTEFVSIIVDHLANFARLILLTFSVRLRILSPQINKKIEITSQTLDNDDTTMMMQSQ